MGIVKTSPKMRIRKLFERSGWVCVQDSDEPDRIRSSDYHIYLSPSGLVQIGVGWSSELIYAVTRWDPAGEAQGLDMHRTTQAAFLGQLAVWISLDGNGYRYSPRDEVVDWIDAAQTKPIEATYGYPRLRTDALTKRAAKSLQRNIDHGYTLPGMPSELSTAPERSRIDGLISAMAVGFALAPLVGALGSWSTSSLAEKIFLGIYAPIGLGCAWLWLQVGVHVGLRRKVLGLFGYRWDQAVEFVPWVCGGRGETGGFSWRWQVHGRLGFFQSIRRLQSRQRSYVTIELPTDSVAAVAVAERIAKDIVDAYWDCSGVAMAEDARERLDIELHEIAWLAADLETASGENALLLKESLIEKVSSLNERRHRVRRTRPADIETVDNRPEPKTETMSR